MIVDDVMIDIGSRVVVWKWVLDRYYVAVGVVQNVNGEMIMVCGDWWRARNDSVNICRLARAGEQNTKKEVCDD